VPYFQRAGLPTEASVRKAIETAVVQQNVETQRPKVDARFGAIIALYRKEHLPTLQHSTQELRRYLFRRYIEPKFKDELIRNVTPLSVVRWFQELKLAPTSKASIRSVMSQCFELAALHEYIPATERNPMSVVKIKGTTIRQKKIAELTIENFKKLIEALPEPINIMTLVAGNLGLRVSELVALQWQDINWKCKEVSIKRKFTHGKLGPTKTVASEAKLPLDDDLLAVLAAWKPKTGDSEWIFPSPRTGGPRAASMLLQFGLKPAVEKLGLGHVTWHTLRHACRSWLGGAGTSASTQKDLLRHSDIGMTMNYGHTLSTDMRRAHNKVAKHLVPRSMLPK
jgi:integrase